MTPRERLLATLRHEIPDRVPKEAGFTPHVLEVFRQKTGAQNPADYFGFESRGVGLRRASETPNWREIYAEQPPEGTVFDDFGCGRLRGSFYHFTSRYYPVEHFDSPKQLLAYPWPEYDASHLAEQVAEIHARGLAASGHAGHIWETAWQMRRMEKLMIDFVENEEFAATLLDKITDRRVQAFRAFAEAGCDFIRCGDDVGMQHTMMMSPSMWRDWLKPRLARCIAAARAVVPDIPVLYHSDGYIEPIIPDLIEIGVTILNPVQPECMDPVKLKKEYGAELCFWGTIGTQTTMPFGTPDDVRAWVKKMIAEVGYDGGLVLAPTHVLEPDVPWENIVAMFQAIEQYGVYR